MASLSVLSPTYSRISVVRSVFSMNGVVGENVVRASEGVGKIGGENTTLCDAMLALFFF